MDLGALIQLFLSVLLIFLVIVLVICLETLNSFLLLPSLMAFDAGTFRELIDRPESAFTVATIIALSVISLTIGNHVAMRLSLITGVRYYLGLLLVVLATLLTYVVAALVFWAGAAIFVASATEFSWGAFWTALKIVGIGFAPLMLGFIVLIPHLGPRLVVLLYVWCLLLLVNVAQIVYGFAFWQALLCAA